MLCLKFFKKKLIVFLIISNILLLSGCNEQPPTNQRELDLGEVVRVVDGDTFILDINGEETKVRLIGVDTPESVSSDESRNTPQGKEISDIVKEKIMKGDTLQIEYDVSATDKYGRILAYLYFTDGKMVQEWLLENGYAKCMTIQPDVKYAEQFAKLQREAAENRIGLWNGFFEE